MVISTFLPVRNISPFFQTCHFWRCETGNLSNVAWILFFLTVTNERICIILPLLQEVGKANKPVQGKQ